MLANKQPILTVLGGMGPMAGIELHKRIIFNTVAKRDQDHYNIQHICFPCLVDDRTQYLKSPKGVNPGLQAGELFKNTIGDNSYQYIIGVPCNTFHSSTIFNVFRNTITTDRANVEIINMVESTVNYIKNKKYGKIGLLSTEGTRRTGVYENLIKKAGMDLIMVPETRQHEVDDIIYNEEYGIKSLSYANDKVTYKTEKIIDSLLNEGADCIILGCTELPIIIGEKFYKNIEVINPIDILAKEMIKTAENFKNNIYHKL